MAVHKDPKQWQRATQQMIVRKEKAVVDAFDGLMREVKKEFITLSQGPLNTAMRKERGYPYARDRAPFRYGKRLIQRQSAGAPDYIINKNSQGNAGLLADSYRIVFRTIGHLRQYGIINTAEPDFIVLLRQGRRRTHKDGTTSGSTMRTRGTGAEVNRRTKRKIIPRMKKAWREG